MNPYLADPDVTLYHGDALDVLRQLPDGCVDMVATSPPFYGLRDYGTGTWEGGDPDCDHTRHKDYGEKSDTNRGSIRGGPMLGSCSKCGATRVDSQIGLEETPDEWVARLVAVFRECRRVLADHGTLWVEIGDSYAGAPVGSFNGGGPAMAGRNLAGHATSGSFDKAKAAGIPAKNLLGQPWMLAFALRADGWVLRSEIIWSRPNPMPESVTDRPTKAHSTVFLFAKARWSGPVEPWPMREQDKVWLAAIVDGEGSICFQESTRAEHAPHISPRLSIVNTNRELLSRVAEVTNIAEGTTPSPRQRKDGGEGRPIFTWQVTNEKAARIIAAIEPHLIAKRRQAALAIYVQALNQKHKGRGGHRTTDADLAAKRRAAEACSSLNRTGDADLSWFKPIPAGRWIPNSYAYDADAIREPHKTPVVDGKFTDRWGRPQRDKMDGNGATSHASGAPGSLALYANPAGANARSVWTIATEPTPFAHFATWPQALVRRMVLAGCREGGTVLDPFGGSGTTGLVARKHGRKAVLVELNEEYCNLAADRLSQLSLLSELG